MHGELAQITDILKVMLATPNGSKAAFERFDEFEVHLRVLLEKQHHAQLQAMVFEFSKFAKQQAHFLNVILNGGGISATDDTTSAQEEKIVSMMARYGLTREEAKERVLGAAVYGQGRGTMGGQA